MTWTRALTRSRARSTTRAGTVRDGVKCHFRLTPRLAVVRCVFSSTQILRDFSLKIVLVVAILIVRVGIVTAFCLRHGWIDFYDHLFFGLRRRFWNFRRFRRLLHRCRRWHLLDIFRFLRQNRLISTRKGSNFGKASLERENTIAIYIMINIAIHLRSQESLTEISEQVYDPRAPDSLALHHHF